jgi:F420-dependent oxidoreductase-like protein
VLRVPAASLVVLIGSSSAGKSTWAARWFRPDQVVASDDLRAAVGESRHDQRASADAFDLLERIVAARAARRLTTVVDTLGTDADRRGGWLALARRHGLHAVAVRFDVPAAVVRARNRDRVPAIPGAALTGQLRAAAALSEADLLAEGFDGVVTTDGDDLPVRHVTTAVLDAPARAAEQHEEPRPMRIGLQISRFDPPADRLRDHLREVAQAAEAAGLDSLWLMDHVIQIPQVGREWDDILESWTTLGFLAAVTDRVRLGTLVTGITYRNLAHLAKIAATLDVLSGGRAVCGIGAAWFEREHTAYGWDFPDVGGRYDRLRDACELLPRMWGPGTPAFAGRTTTVPEAICYPRPLQAHLPILVGGSGERTTLRVVAEHADACNLFGDPATVARRVRVLHDHCAAVGRDPAAIEVTCLAPLLAAPDEAVLAERVAALTPAGRAPELAAERLDAGTVADQIGRFRAYADAGVHTAIVTMPVIDAERVAELAPLVAAFSAGGGAADQPPTSPMAAETISSTPTSTRSAAGPSGT